MKLNKYFSIITLLLFFVLANIANAQNTSNVTMVADVNISGAKIVDQVGSVFNISFVLTNGKSAQNNVYYSVRLSPKGKPNTILEEKVYDENLTLLENSTTRKTIVYEAPKTLSGDYSLYLFVGNTSGLMLGYYSLGDIKLVSSQKSLFLDSSTCSLLVEGKGEKKKYAISASPVVFAGQSLTLDCSITNPSIKDLSLSPNLETRAQSIYGDIVEVSSISDTVNLKPLEKKAFSLKIPTAQNAGVYKTKLSFFDGTNNTNEIIISYNTYGFSANIFNISSDKDVYMKNEVANITTLWTSNAKEVASMEVKISSGRGVVCGSSSFEKPVFNQSVLVSIKKNCYDPKIALTLKDVDGETIVERYVSIPTTSVSKDSGIFSGKKGAILLVLLLIIIATIGIIMKRKKVTTIGGIAVFLVLAFLPSAKAQAATYWIGAQNDIRVIVNISNPLNPGSTVFNQGDTLLVDGYMDTASSLTRDVSLSAITIGNISKDIFPTVVALGPSQPSFMGDQRDFQVSVPTQNGQPIAGNYNVDFTAGVDNDAAIVQNYGNETNLAAIMGICNIMPDPYSGETGYLKAIRDVATEASATARGVTSVDFTFRIRTDNEDVPQTSEFTARFLPGQLEVDLEVSKIDHDIGGYCSAVACDGWTCPQDIVENF